MAGTRRARKDPPGNINAQWPGGRGATNPALKKAKSKYKTPGVVDHPERLAARKALAAARAQHQTETGQRRKQSTPGVIDHPKAYMARHPGTVVKNGKVVKRRNPGMKPSMRGQ